MINSKNAKELRRGIRNAFHLPTTPRGSLGSGEELPGDYKVTEHNKRTAILDKMHPRSLYRRAKRGLLLSRQTINRGL